MISGEIVFGHGHIRCNEGRRTVTIKVTNTSRFPVQVSSHMHFFEVNKRMRFPRHLAFGMRLDIPAGSAVRWEPGETKEVRLVEFAGRRQAWGFNGLVNGQLTHEGLTRALRNLKTRGFLTED